MVSKGQFVGQFMILLALESPVAQWLQHPTRSWRVVGSNPVWDSDISELVFFPVFTFDIMFFL